jgi:excisionase family DNA binding protein
MALVAKIMTEQTGTQEERNEFLTARQLAAILQISESTVRKLAHAGKIPSIRLTSRLIRFHLPSVREALDHANKHHQRKHSTDNEEENRQLSFADLL